MTKFQLMSALFGGSSLFTNITASDGRVYNGIVTKIEREDGSGRCFNVSMWLHHPVHGTISTTVFVRTID